MKIKNRNAFSLLELMTVIAIITILAAISLTYLSPTRYNAKLKAAQRELSSALNQAHSFALEGKQIGTNAPTSFGVCIDSISGYKLIYDNDCNNNLIGTYKFPSGVTVSSAIPVKINFNVPHGECSNNPTIFLQISGISKSVSVTTGGVVTESD